MANEAKYFLYSKTFIVGVLEVAIGVLSFVLGELQTGTALTATGILTVLLRLVTSQTVKFTK